jgi:anaerobic ribonucleoside-triphosphate reductase activating protein
MSLLPDETILRVSHFECNTTLLGPYNRFVVWVYGCCFACEGCMAHNTNYGTKTEMTVRKIAAQIPFDEIEGLTISGGEPFLQASELFELVSLARQIKDIGVIVYTGFTIEELRRDEKNISLLSAIDLLIDGKYVKELDDGKAYVGSTNQRIHYLTGRYKEIGSGYYSGQKRKAEIKLTGSQAVLIGVPSAEALRVWDSMKHKTGGVVYDF